MAESGLLIIFTRTPVPGYTKTRLIPELGAAGAADLHMQLLLHTAKIASRSRFDRVEIHAYPDLGYGPLRQLAGNLFMDLRKQTGWDLGERMFNSLAQENHDFAVIVGSDCPALDSKILDHAYVVLAQGQSQAVLGPSEDGGYYLIGMQRPEKSLFNNIKWGSHTVAEATRTALEARGWRWQELEKLWDVDVPADLERLWQSPGLMALLEQERNRNHVAESV